MRQISLCLALASLLLGTPAAEATTLWAGIGLFRGEAVDQKHTLYVIEMKNEQRSWKDFRISLLNHTDGRTIWDTGEFSYQGIGFDFEPIRINLDIGWVASLGKYARDEIDYGISRSIGGGHIDIDLMILHLWGGVRRYLPYESHTAKVDSFSLTFNPEPYHQVRAGLTIAAKSLEIKAEVGRFQDLAGRIDYLGEGYALEADPVTYGKATLKMSSGNTSTRSCIIAEWHQLLAEPEDRLTMQKLLGTALQRDIFDGGIVGLGFEF